MLSPASVRAVRDWGEVWAGVGGQRHELDVPFTGLGQFQARHDAWVVAVQHDHEQHRLVVGEAPDWSRKEIGMNLS